MYSRVDISFVVMPYLRDMIYYLSDGHFHLDLCLVRLHCWYNYVANVGAKSQWGSQSPEGRHAPSDVNFFSRNNDHRYNALMVDFLLF